MLWGQLVPLPAACCSSAGREPLQQCAPGDDDDDDDHNACDDEFSSCGQLDSSTERGRNRRKGKVDIKVNLELGRRLGESFPLDKRIWNCTVIDG